MFVFRQPAKIIENEFAFAAGVTRVDDLGDVFSRDELFQSPEDILRRSDRLEFKLLGNDRQGLQPPEPVFFLVDVLRHQQLDDMPDGGRDHVLVVLEMVALFRHLTESTGEVAGHAGLLGDDERFGHVVLG